MPGNMLVTATCPHCAGELPEAETPHVCETCGTTKADVVLTSLTDSNSSLFCTPCITMMYAKALNDAIATGGEQPA